VTRLAALVAIAACHGSTDPSPAPPPPSPAAPVAPPSKTVSASTPALGALAPSPAPPTVERFRARSCAATPPIELGATEAGRGAMAAFGASGGLVAWSPKHKRLAVRPVDRTGKPTGAMRELDVPADLDNIDGLRALDGNYLVFLREDDFSGGSPIVKLYALALAGDGTAMGAPLELDTGPRGMLDAVSPAAARGVLVYAGATPATNVDTLRIVTVYVAPDGKLAQATRDFPDPTPGTRAFPRYTFSAEHAAIVLPEHLLVDGELRPLSAEPTIEGMLVAPAFTGDAIPVLGFTSVRPDGKRRYGTIDLSGKRHFDRKEEPQSAPLRAPFENLVKFGVTGRGAGASAFVLGQQIPLAFPGLSSGIDTQIIWTGDQAVVLYVAGTAVRLAPLPCN
jgi:hypothetical protein